ncbi:MAG: RhuM family protein [Paludibacter sp.]|nr:RhuM family protein [Paludibacter sp.]
MFSTNYGVDVRKLCQNYLKEDEISLLGLLVEQYLAFAETMAQQRIPMYMADWIQRLDVIT